MESQDLERFDGGIDRRLSVKYIRAGEDTARSGEIVTGRHGGRVAARIWLEGEELIDFREGHRFPIKFEHPDSPERAEAEAIKYLRAQIGGKGGRLILGE